MASASAVPLVPLLLELLGQQGEQERSDPTDRPRTPWEMALSPLFRAMTVPLSDEFAPAELLRREYLLPDENWDEGGLRAYLARVRLDEAEGTSRLSAELARLDAEGFGDSLIECLRPMFPAETEAILTGIRAGAGSENATHRPPSPPRGVAPTNQPARLTVPNETTEQPIIDALYKLGAIGVAGLRAIEQNQRPTGERLAPRAIGRGCDGQFKATLAHMVDLGWLGNGRDYGLVGGYFLTDAGLALVTKR